jgi:hypothetical protein
MFQLYRGCQFYLLRKPVDHPIGLVIKAIISAPTFIITVTGYIEGALLNSYYVFILYCVLTIVLLNDLSSIIYHIICTNINVKCVEIGS